jgi:hypothetical protein
MGNEIPRPIYLPNTALMEKAERLGMEDNCVSNKFIGS